ncbi:protein NRT1/ PTR FAMILY 5.6-like [Juglans microcarpa x Juglans regia]|uniref:protein NRT1/ PTR FAMILY 5.6-like n=1 Tax=Juglans microcarpa x Juglans regia TaxID=2249226 RepID=UPI001B7EB8C7|nr:protein NRT1/ PTR FAMILY 5.6-like [Juglans microcarpa x Juglans regia]
MELEMEKNRRGVVVQEESCDGEKWVHDSSVDHKGRVPLRASTGIWKASSFIIMIEFSERLSYFGIATNLISYLTRVIHQDLKTAVKNVNYWAGVTTLMPLLGGLLADAYTGRFTMVLFSSLIYLMGLCLFTMSQFIPSLKPYSEGTSQRPRKIHEVVFFLGLYFISVGTGGHKPCLESFGADQFDDDHSEERKKKMSYFNWWNFALSCGLLLGVTVIAYVQDYVSWGVADLILTLSMAIAVVTFYLGKPYYRYRIPEGSPLTPMFQVLVAAIRKRNLPVPTNPALLYEVPKSQKPQRRLLGHTNRLRFLDKAATIEEDRISIEQNPWRLATVTTVEETKLILNMIPVWLTSLTFGICIAQTTTFFIKQAATMNLNITENFKIPPASINALGAIAMIISVTVYDKILVPMLRKATGNERGINILQRIGIGMLFSVVAMSVAALVEMKRLRAVEKEIIQGGKTGPLSLSAFWLAPQIIIIGVGDGFAVVGLQEYFYDQVPDSMRSLGIAFYLSVLGAGSFLSSFLIIVVDHVTEKGGRSWFAQNVNLCRLDNFYWLLAAMSGLNLCVFVMLAIKYTYKNVQRRIIG